MDIFALVLQLHSVNGSSGGRTLRKLASGQGRQIWSYQEVQGTACQVQWKDSSCDVAFSQLFEYHESSQPCKCQPSQRLPFMSICDQLLSHSPQVSLRSFTAVLGHAAFTLVAILLQQVSRHRQGYWLICHFDRNLCHLFYPSFFVILDFKRLLWLCHYVFTVSNRPTVLALMSQPPGNIRPAKPVLWWFLGLFAERWRIRWVGPVHFVIRLFSCIAVLLNCDNHL